MPGSGLLCSRLGHLCPQMRSLLGVAATALLLLLLACTPAHARTHEHKRTNLTCGFNGLDFTPLTHSLISTTDWATLNYYWQPCGVLDSDAPSLCQGSGFEHSGACRIQMFTQEVVSIGDWSAEGQVRWRAIAAGDVEQFPTRSGAVVEFQSPLSNCTSESGDLQPFTTSIALVCDEDGLYDLHGPLDFEVDVPCDYKMSMLTVLACDNHKPYQARTRRQQH